MSIMRRIDSIIIHCSATQAGMDFSAKDIDCWHRARGMNEIGYHYVVRLDGSVEPGREVARMGAHCIGWNERSIGICYIGGLDAGGHPADTRTRAQKETLKRLIEELKQRYGIVTVMGHRDTSPDLNGDGRIEPDEFIKACPCFDVKKWLLIGVILLFLSACGSSHFRMERNVEIDSVTAKGHYEKVDNVRKTEWENNRQADEHIEETVFIWKADTIGVGHENGRAVQRKSFSVTKKVVDRGRMQLQKGCAEHSFVKADSSFAVGKSLIKVDEREKKQRRQIGGLWAFVAIAGFLVICILFFRKFFVVDNQ